jgi:multiple sugar transport system substrate-binding protein
MQQQRRDACGSQRLECAMMHRNTGRSVRRVGVALLLLLGNILSGGCRSQTRESHEEGAPANGKSRLLVIDDSSLAEAIRQQWSAGAGEVEVVEATETEASSSNERWAGIDAVIYPAALLGTLAEQQQIVPLNDRTLNDDNLNWSQVFHLVRLRETEWDRRPFAVSLGSPVFVLFYRADLWQRWRLPPPSTWEAYGRALAELQMRTAEDSAGGAVAGSAEPLGPGWGGQILLARAAAYAQHRSYLSVLFEIEEMRPLIDGPPFVRALEELMAANAGADGLQWGPQDTLQALLDGKSAAAIGWPTSKSTTAVTGGGAGMQIGLSELPGGSHSYDRKRDVWDERADDDLHVTLLSVSGRLGSITRRTSSERVAASLLVWMAGKEWSHQLSPASSATTLFRQDQVAESQRWLNDKAFPNSIAAPYAAAVMQSLERSSSVVSLRIPGCREYMTVLDGAVARAVRGEASAADALREAAERWQEITEKLGRSAQREAYRHSLGL